MEINIFLGGAYHGLFTMMSSSLRKPFCTIHLSLRNLDLNQTNAEMFSKVHRLQSATRRRKELGRIPKWHSVTSWRATFGLKAASGIRCLQDQKIRIYFRGWLEKELFLLAVGLTEGTGETQRTSAPHHNWMLWP